jgi:hypothetical protein
MPAPYKVYARKCDVAFTASQIEAAKHRAALEGKTFSDVVRDALDAYLAKKPRPHGRKRRAAA